MNKSSQYTLLNTEVGRINSHLHLTIYTFDTMPFPRVLQADSTSPHTVN